MRSRFARISKFYGWPEGITCKPRLLRLTLQKCRSTGGCKVEGGPGVKLRVKTRKCQCKERGNNRTQHFSTFHIKVYQMSQSWASFVHLLFSYFPKAVLGAKKNICAKLFSHEHDRIHPSTPEQHKTVRTYRDGHIKNEFSRKSRCISWYFAKIKALRVILFIFLLVKSTAILYQLSFGNIGFRSWRGLVFHQSRVAFK